MLLNGTEKNTVNDSNDTHVRFLTKYKPTTIDEFQLDSNMKLFIEKILIPEGESILLVGPSGCGKTVLIDYIIKHYYQYCNGSNKNNVLVINSLSETGITFYKYDLKSFCQSKHYGKQGKKIVLIEDVDTLNDTIYDVIVSYIDEYKDNVMFIQTTSCIEKIKHKINCFTIAINSLNKDLLSKKYFQVKAKEGLNINTSCDSIILSLCNNSVRSLLNVLEKISILNIEVTEENVFSVCSNINYRYFENFTNFILDDNPSESLKEIMILVNDGYSTSDILYYYYYYVKELSKLPLNKKLCVIKTISKYISIVNNANDGDHFIIAFVDSLLFSLSSFTD